MKALRWLLLLAGLSSACGSPTGPTSLPTSTPNLCQGMAAGSTIVSTERGPFCVAPPATPTRPSTTLLLSGQSNAVQLRPYLERAYAPIGRVDGFAYGGSQIGWWLLLPPWSPSTPYTPWMELEPLLHQPARAFIWWQGESDSVDPERPDPAGYAEKLSLLLAKVRTENHDATLPILVCQIRDNHVSDTSAIREQIRLVVARDPLARLVSADDLPSIDSFHFTPDGYRLMADRLIQALP